METVPAPCQKATRHKLLWLAGTRGTAQPAVPGCPRLWLSPTGCTSPPPPCPSPHISCLRPFCLSPHPWSEGSFLCQGEYPLSHQAVPRLELAGLQKAYQGKHLLHAAQGTSPASTAALQVPEPRVLEGCAPAQQFLAGMKEGIFGPQAESGHAFLLLPQSASSQFTLMLGVMWALCHQEKLWDHGDGGRSNSCRK